MATRTVTTWIRNGFIVDGTGKSGFYGDVVIRDGRIADVRHRPAETLKSGSAAAGSASGSASSPAADGPAPDDVVIDATGRTVTPGFVDVHSHSDLSILANPRAESSLRQGITTEIAGNCGWSMAPVTKATADTVGNRLIGSLAGKDAAEAIPWTWSTMAEYQDFVEERGTGNNQGTYVGQSMVRAYVLGRDDRLPSSKELAKMKSLVRQAMEEGAFGLSTGRSYFPGRLAGTPEVIELAREIAPFHGLYTSHIRNQDVDIMGATQEVIDIGRGAGCAVQVAHQKVCAKKCWGQAPQVLELMEKGRDHGVDVYSDIYPFNYTQISNMARILPSFVTEGSTADAVARLRDPSNHPRVLEEATARAKAWGSSDPLAGLGRTGVVFCRKTKELEGLDLDEVAARYGLPLFETVLALLADNDLMVKTAGIMSEEDTSYIIKHPFSMISTDAFALDKEMDEAAAIHPRHYATYPRIIDFYVRQKRLLTLEEAVWKMAGFPAARVGLLDRGTVRKGAWADILVFDPDTVAEASTIEKPAQFSPGIDYVLVNGQVVLDRGIYHDVRAGHVLRKGS